MFLWHSKEAFFWLAALVFLACIDPAHHHYTLCPFNQLGWECCPGCGLGRSIAYFYRLDIRASFMAHPLGIPAVLLFLNRCYQVFRIQYKIFTTKNQMNYVDAL